MDRRAFGLSCFVFLTAACSRDGSTHPSPTEHKTLYIVRHAEKQVVEGESDPELTEAGHARAAALADALEGVTIDGIYSSNYRRTQQTVAPYARASGLSVISYDPGDARAFAATLRSASGRRLLIAGHSNTIPALIDALGASAPTIADDQYGDLFVLTLDGDAATLEVQHFGP